MNPLMPSGIIYTLSTIGSNLAVGVLCAAASTLLILECVYGLWAIRSASWYYRSKGMSMEAAKREAASGVASSSVGREIAGQAVKSQFARV